MMTIEQIRESLSDRNLRVVADRAGISYQTVWRIATDNTENPSHESVRKLSNYLKSSCDIKD